MGKRGPSPLFDHDEARALYATGKFDGPRLAERYGVSRSAIYRVVNPAIGARMHAASVERAMSGVCVDCGGRCARYSTGDQRCRACASKRRATSVRDDALRCIACREWKPDTEFPRHRGETHRRGRHDLCRDCNTAQRRDYRERHKVPCVRCGGPCLPASEKGHRQADTGLCLSCYRATRPHKTHCIHGHERTPENLYPDGSCRICDRARKRARRARERQRVAA